MTGCWPEGELRAYLDGELASEELARVAAHLAECAECARITSQLEARAHFVSGALSELVARPGTHRIRHRRGFVAAAAALAAGLAVGALLLPKRQPPAARVSTAAIVTESPTRVETVASAPAVTRVAKPARRRAVRRPSPPDNGFVRLDDEPFETGVVLRVALGPEQVPADVVFGSDGRARAVRLVGFR